MLPTITFARFFQNGNFLVLHPLSCSLPNVCKHWLSQDQQKKRAFPHFSIEDKHGEWWMSMISFIMCTEEKINVPSDWNSDALQLELLIFFFLYQDCIWFCMFSFSPKFICIMSYGEWPLQIPNIYKVKYCNGSSRAWKVHQCINHKTWSLSELRMQCVVGVG